MTDVSADKQIKQLESFIKMDAEKIKDLEARIAELESDLKEFSMTRVLHRKETISKLREALEDIDFSSGCTRCKENQKIAETALKECFGEE